MTPFGTLTPAAAAALGRLLDSIDRTRAAGNDRNETRDGAAGEVRQFDAPARPRS